MDPGNPLEDAVFRPVLGPAQARGLSAEDVIAAIKGFGLAVGSADDPWFTDDEASVFIALAKLEALWPRDTYVQVSRVYGQALATIARAEVQSVLRSISDGLAAETSLRELRDGVDALLPLADPILAGIHRRWIEHELAQVSAYAAEEDVGGAALGAAHVALLFIDVKDFTAFVDTAGDRAGIDLIEHFDRIVSEERGDSGQLVKALGDGFMLAYPNAVDAVAAAARMMRRMPRTQGPALHASVHEGLALYPGGDYFGRGVNPAAARPGLPGTDELLATRAVVESSAEQFAWEPRTTTQIRGFREPIEI